MLHSEAERVVRKIIEETGAQFTEEQVQAICRITTKIAATVVEEAFSNWSPGQSNKRGFFAG